jgi:ABC-2 type transport system ATP-binding protein
VVPGPDPAIQVQSLTKRFGALTAVDRISFEVQRGEVFGILGPNGAGKTTALECIEGLQLPTEGKTRVFGVDTAREADRTKGRIGVQLQASAYFDYLTLNEILDLFGRIYDRRAEPTSLLERVGLTDKADTVVNKLSGGQQQRFTVAAALVNDPEVVFLDEPTTGLDPQARRNLWEVIRGLRKEGRTVIMTTHYMEEAEELCDRVAIMNRGSIVALDTPDALIRTLPVPYVVSATIEPPMSESEIKALTAVGAVEIGEAGAVRISSSNSAATVPDLIAAVSSVEGRRLIDLEVRMATLEDLFLSLTGRDLRE